MRFRIEIDMNRWLRGSARNRKRLIQTRRESAMAIALAVESEAKANLDAHKLKDSTGYLRESIIAVPTPEGAAVQVLAPYAWYVEYGTGIHNVFGRGRRTPWVYKHRSRGYVRTRGRKAKPFFGPAVIQAELMSSKILRGVFDDTRRLR